MTEFSPFTALIGGAFIGFAALGLLLFNGRIAGVSGIFSALVAIKNTQVWQWLFVAGLVIGPVFAGLFGFELAPPINTPWLVLLIAGFCVGFGARLGSGCTSGHGICGVGRLSFRSIIATSIFMVTAIITAFVCHHLL